MGGRAEVSRGQVFIKTERAIPYGTISMCPGCPQKELRDESGVKA